MLTKSSRPRNSDNMDSQIRTLTTLVGGNHLNSIEKKCFIKSLPAATRKYILERVKNGEITRISGASVQPAEFSVLPPEYEKLLTLNIRGPVHSSVNLATNYIEQLEFEANKWVRNIPVGLEYAVPEFKLVDKIFGPNGNHFRYIRENSGALVALCEKKRGRILRNPRIPPKGPLYIEVWNPDPSGLSRACYHANIIVQYLKQEYSDFNHQVKNLVSCLKKVGTPANVHQEHTGFDYQGQLLVDWLKTVIPPSSEGILPPQEVDQRPNLVFIPPQVLEENEPANQVTISPEQVNQAPSQEIVLPQEENQGPNLVIKPPQKVNESSEQVTISPEQMNRPPNQVIVPPLALTDAPVLPPFVQQLQEPSLTHPDVHNNQCTSSINHDPDDRAKNSITLGFRTVCKALPQVVQPTRPTVKVAPSRLFQLHDPPMPVVTVPQNLPGTSTLKRPLETDKISSNKLTEPAPSKREKRDESSSRKSSRVSEKKNKTQSSRREHSKRIKKSPSSPRESRVRSRDNKDERSGGSRKKESENHHRRRDETSKAQKSPSNRRESRIRRRDNKDERSTSRLTSGNKKQGETRQLRRDETSKGLKSPSSPRESRKRSRDRDGRSSGRLPSGSKKKSETRYGRRDNTSKGQKSSSKPKESCPRSRDKRVERASRRSPLGSKKENKKTQHRSREETSKSGVIKIRSDSDKFDHSVISASEAGDAYLQDSKEVTVGLQLLLKILKTQIAAKSEGQQKNQLMHIMQLLEQALPASPDSLVTEEQRTQLLAALSLFEKELQTMSNSEMVQENVKVLKHVLQKLSVPAPLQKESQVPSIAKQSPQTVLQPQDPVKHGLLPSQLTQILQSLQDVLQIHTDNMVMSQRKTQLTQIAQMLGCLVPEQIENVLIDEWHSQVLMAMQLLEEALLIQTDGERPTQLLQIIQMIQQALTTQPSSAVSTCQEQNQAQTLPASSNTQTTTVEQTLPSGVLPTQIGQHTSQLSLMMRLLHTALQALDDSIGSGYAKSQLALMREMLQEVQIQDGTTEPDQKIQLIQVLHLIEQALQLEAFIGTPDQDSTNVVKIIGLIRELLEKYSAIPLHQNTKTQMQSSCNMN